MPRGRSTTKSELSHDDLLYLAGIFESGLGLRGIGTSSAVAISSTEDWPKAMAEKYGGEHHQFTSSKGKVYWGWYVTLARRIELVKMMEQAEPKVTLATSAYDWDGIRGKLEKAHSNETLGKDLD